MTAIVPFLLLAVYVVVVESAVFTACLKQPEGKNWYLKDSGMKNVYYKCINGVPVKRSCFFFLCSCIGPGCAHAEGETYQCDILAKCPALSIDNRNILDSCRGNPCLNKGVCKADGKNFICKCASGYYGNICQKDVCNPDQCTPRGYCIRLTGANFRCSCRKGYYGTTCESDACLDIMCKNGFCRRLVNGKSNCICKRGYIGRQCETKVCDLKPCLNNGYCTGRKNRLGYLCYCKNGFTGYHCEIKNMTGNCQGNTCKNGATCANIVGGHHCLCATGYYGIKCQKDHCQPTPCQNQGSCVRTAYGHACQCAIGYIGKDCEVDSCSPSPCQNSGTCTAKAGGYICSCLIGYSGLECQIDHCGINRCKNGGTCERTVLGYTCLCSTDFHGIHCRIPYVTEAPFDPATFFDCEYGFTTMTGSSLFKGIMGIEKCKTWCYIREDTVSQTIRRGCWYPGLYNNDPVLNAEPMPGCGFFKDNLMTTDSGNEKTYCFCRTSEGECNAGDINTVIHRMPLLSRLI